MPTSSAQPTSSQGDCRRAYSPVLDVEARTVTVPSGADAERADEASNKSTREPLVSRKSSGGSRGAKPHTRNGLAARNIDPRMQATVVEQGSRPEVEP